MKKIENRLRFNKVTVKKESGSYFLAHSVHTCKGVNYFFMSNLVLFYFYWCFSQLFLTPTY